MCDPRLIRPINECEFTGLEKGGAILGYHGKLRAYTDNYGQYRLVAYQDDQPIAGILLSGGNVRIVRHMFTAAEYRRQGYMRELLAYTRCKFGKSKVRFDSNLTTDGALFVASAQITLSGF